MLTTNSLKSDFTDLNNFTYPCHACHVRHLVTYNCPELIETSENQNQQEIKL